MWSGVGRRLNGHSALFPWDGPPKDKELGQTKTLLAPFWKLFLFLMVSNPAMLQHTVQKQTHPPQSMAFYCQRYRQMKTHPLLLFEQDLTVKQAAVLFHLQSECQTPLGAFLIK